MARTEPPTTMRIGRHFAQRVLLRTGAGKRGEPRVDAAVGRAAPGLSGVWQPAAHGLVATRGPGGEPQTSGSIAGANGSGSDLSQAQFEPTRRRAPDLSAS